MTATGAFGSATAELPLRADGTKPTLSLDGGLRPAPITKRVPRANLTLQGRPRYAGWTGVAAGGESARLTSAASEASYRFSRTVSLPPGEPRTITVTAWGRAGNERRKTFRIRGAPGATESPCAGGYSSS